MKRVLAIAGITVRSAVRSRIVVVLLAMLLVAIVALPLTIKSDGTVAGHVHISLLYTLTAVSIILSVATLWAGCAAIAAEIQDRQIHLIVTKPVFRIELWFGKWLGLMALNTVFLVLAGAVTYGFLRWNLRPERLSAKEQQQLREEILVARRPIRPEPIPVEDQARELLSRQPVAPPASPDQVLQAIRESLRRQAHSVPAGVAVRFTFRLPQLPAGDRPMILRYKFASSDTDKNPVAAMFVAGAVERSDRLQVGEFRSPDGIHTVAIPPGMLAADRTLTLDIANINPVPVTMVFDPDGGLELLTYEGTFAGNLLRALAVILCKLGFLTALAVTMGSLYSLPVAALATGYVVLLTQIGSYLQSLATSGNENPLLRLVYVTLYWMSKPFQTPDPLAKLAAGELIGWWWLGSVFLWQVIVGAGILAAAGNWFFNRRELGLPT